MRKLALLIVFLLGLQVSVANAESAAGAAKSNGGKTQGLYDATKQKVKKDWPDMKDGAKKAYDASKAKMKEGYQKSKSGIEKAYDDTKAKTKQTYDKYKKKVSD